MTTVGALVSEVADRSDCAAPAFAWGVMIDGRLDATGGTASSDTAFRIASMTKSFTAAVVLGLRDEGRLALDRPVADYAPELGAVRGPAGSPAITLRHLLSMSAGMATDDPWADRHLDATAEFMNEVYADGVHFAGRTGELFEYSNLGFAMIGRVVRTVTGRAVRDHVDQRLLGPLGMTRTSWERPRGAVAEPHRLRDGVAVHDGAEPLGDGEIAPMGGLWSTVDDLVRWMSWLDGANDDADWLRPSSRREMQTIQNYFGAATLDGAAAPSGYGFGLLVRDDPTIGMVAGHSGGLPGYGSNMRWKRGAGVGVVGLANITYAPMSTFTHRALLALAQGGHAGVETSPVDPLLLERAHALVALFERWDDDVAQSLFADNVALDEALDRRRADTDSWVRGRALRVITVTSSSRTSGTIEVAAGDSRFDIDFSLSPHRALVQTWSWRKRS